MFNRLTGTAAAVAVAFGVLLPAAPAAAAYPSDARCQNEHAPIPGDNYARLCVTTATAGTAQATLTLQSTYDGTVTILLKQCDGYGHDCGIMAANSGAVRGGQGIVTSHKPLSHGHAYQACANVSIPSFSWSAYFCSSFIPVS